MTELLDRARAMIVQLSTKEPGFGMAYALTDTRRSCELYGKRAEAAVWLIEHGKEVVAALAALSTLPDAVAGEREATVRWLREKATGQDIYRKEVPFRGGWYLSERRSAEYRVLADAIERGDHLAAAIRKEPS